MSPQTAELGPDQPNLDSDDAEHYTLLRESIAKVLEDRCDSRSLHDYIDGKNILDEDLWSHAVELGWFAISAPETTGGLGMGWGGLSILFAELGRHAAPGPYLETLVASEVLNGPDVRETCDDVAAQLIAGDISAAVPANGSSATGEVVTLLGSPSASVALVHDGDGHLLLLSVPAGMAEAIPTWDLTRSLVRLRTTDCKVIFKLPTTATSRFLTALALGIAHDSVGGSASISERTQAYLKERIQFGKPLASFQALKHRIANQASANAVNEQLCVQACATADQGTDLAAMWALLAKAETTDTFVNVAGDCLRLHGGVGFTWEFDPHIFLKRARLNEMLLDTNNQLRDKAAAILKTETNGLRTTLEI